jgi:hypothetical protein
MIAEPKALAATVPAYVVLVGLAELKAPLAACWSAVVNYTSWQDYDLYEHVSGTPGAVGEIVRLGKNEENFKAFPPYYARTIDRSEGRRIIWKCYPDPQFKSVDFAGFVNFEVEPNGEASLFRYTLVYEFILPEDGPDTARTFEMEQSENFANLFDAIIPKLKAVVEN